MALLDRNQGATLPSGYRVLPLRAADLHAPIRVSLLVQESGEMGPFVRLRDFSDGSAVLGCLVDAAGQIHSWLEIAVQHLENLGATNPAYQRAVTNHTLDERWRSWAAQAAALTPADILWTGWEITHPAPLLYDPAAAALLNPVDAAGIPWELCTDDAALIAAGLPAYSSTLARYLAPNSGEKSRFLPVSPDSPKAACTVTPAEVFGKCIPLNPSGGLMLIRTLAPLDFDEWADVLSGNAWKGISRGKRPVTLGGTYATLRDENQMRFGDGHFFLSRRGVSGRAVEAAFLKVQTIEAALSAVETVLQATQVPFLNIDAATFGVALPALSSGLPFLWAHEVRIINPGDALALGVETTSARYFIPGSFGESSVYRPAAAGVAVRGRGEVRIRQVLPPAEGGTVLEASLVTQEKLNISGNDLLCLTLSFAGTSVTLYGRIGNQTGAEVHFRTEPQQLPETTMAALKQAEGAPFAKIPYQVLPILSSACDLYALGVLATRLFLTNQSQTLPVALDELLALARQLPEGEDLSKRVRQLAQSDARWSTSLGSHRVTDEEVKEAIPPELWWELIGWIIRLFPGAAPESFCRDFADAPRLAIEKPFEAARLELASIQRQFRGLIIYDNDSHREIRSVIAKFLETK